MKTGFSGKPTLRQSLVSRVFTKCTWDQQKLWKRREGNRTGQKDKLKLRHWYLCYVLWELQRSKEKGLFQSIPLYIKKAVPFYTSFNQSLNVMSPSVREDWGNASSCPLHSKGIVIKWRKATETSIRRHITIKPLRFQGLSIAFLVLLFLIQVYLIKYLSSI